MNKDNGQYPTIIFPLGYIIPDNTTLQSRSADIKCVLLNGAYYAGIISLKSCGSPWISNCVMMCVSRASQSKIIFYDIFETRKKIYNCTLLFK